LIDQQVIIVSEFKHDINNTQTKSKNIFVCNKLIFKSVTEENKFIQFIVDQYDSSPRHNYA
jgi:hypothetical protein